MSPPDVPAAVRPDQWETPRGRPAADRRAVPLAPGKGISDTRWDARGYTLDRFSNPVVLEAALETVVHVLDTSGESSVIAAALGLKKMILSPRFLLLLCAFKPALMAVKTVSKYLQTVNIDVGAAIDKINTLKAEVRALRNDEAWVTTKAEAAALARRVGVDLEAELESPATEEEETDEIAIMVNVEDGDLDFGQDHMSEGEEGSEATSQ